MASREEEKRRRREERLAQERATDAAAKRKRLLGSISGAILAAAAIAAVVVAIATGGGGGGGQSPVAGNGSATPVPLPPAKEANLQVAAREAGCVVRDYPNFGQEHTTDKVTYKSNPPTSGPHNPQPAQDGAYSPANPPAVGQAVHALEHGRVELQWAPGTPRRTIGQLQSLFDEQGGHHALLFENQTEMPYAIAASAWQHLIGCKRVTPEAFDALRDFRKTYTDKAPEQVP